MVTSQVEFMGLCTEGILPAMDLLYIALWTVAPYGLSTPLRLKLGCRMDGTLTRLPQL